MEPRSYAWWSGRFAGILETLLFDPHDELHRMRARKLLDEFDRQCDEYERQIRPNAPESIRAEIAEIALRRARRQEIASALNEFVGHPERVFSLAPVTGEDGAA